MKETEKVMKQVDKEDRRRSKLHSGKPAVSSTPPMVVRSVAFMAWFEQVTDDDKRELIISSKF